MVLGVDTATQPRPACHSPARGLVFQLPEAQLFEQYVGDDIAFGPRKISLSHEEVRGRVRRAMEAVDWTSTTSRTA